MKPELEGRLRKLELRYAVAPDEPEVLSIRWMTADEIKRGLRPGLYKLPSKDGDSPVVPASLIPEVVARSTGPEGRIAEKE
jgi:hypothetical protein